MRWYLGVRRLRAWGWRAGNGAGRRRSGAGHAGRRWRGRLKQKSSAHAPSGHSGSQLKTTAFRRREHRIRTGRLSGDRSAFGMTSLCAAWRVRRPPCSRATSGSTHRPSFAGVAGKMVGAAIGHRRTESGCVASAQRRCCLRSQAVVSRGRLTRVAACREPRKEKSAEGRVRLVALVCGDHVTGVLARGFKGYEPPVLRCGSQPARR